MEIQAYIAMGAKNGPIPKGHVVIFRDGDKLNFEPDNLVLVTRQELLQMSRNKYLRQPAEIKPVVMTLSKLQVAIFNKKKSGDVIKAQAH